MSRLSGEEQEYLNGYRDGRASVEAEVERLKVVLYRIASEGDASSAYLARQGLAGPKDGITTEALDALQFGRVLHKRPVKGEG